MVSQCFLIVDFNLIVFNFSQIRNCENELEGSEFLNNAIELLVKTIAGQKVNEVICLGIGRISECSIAKHQLAFINIVQRRLEIQLVSFFDPVLSSGEKEVLERLNHKVLSDNKEGKYIANHKTLFYLPHCPKQITNNLLFANWNNENIQNLLLICNSFKSVIESSPERLLRPNAHYILEINPYVCEEAIENNFRFTDIFNDFSIHSISSDKLEEISGSFWENHPEPHYSEDDLELTRNGCD